MASHVYPLLLREESTHVCIPAKKLPSQIKPRKKLLQHVFYQLYILHATIAPSR